MEFHPRQSNNENQNNIYNLFKSSDETGLLEKEDDRLQEFKRITDKTFNRKNWEEKFVPNF